MTYKRFEELWIAAGLNNPPKFDNPLMVDEMSPHTIEALIAASSGDFTAFDEAKKIRCGLSDVVRSPAEVRAYFAKRFAKLAIAEAIEDLKVEDSINDSMRSASL